MKKNRKLFVLALTAILAAFSIVLKLCAVDITESFRIGFESVPIVFAGIFLGPVAGVFTGVLADLLGCVIKGYSINPIITLGAAFVGCLSGLMYRVLPVKKALPKILLATEIAEIIGSGIVKSVGMYVFYLTPVSVLWLRVPIYLVYAFIDAYLVYAILKIPFFRKNGM